MKLCHMNSDNFSILGNSQYGTFAKQNVNSQMDYKYLREKVILCLSCWLTEKFRRRNVILKETLHQNVSGTQAALPGSRRSFKCLISVRRGRPGGE